MEELSYSCVHPIVIKVCHWRQSSSFFYLSASSSIHSVPPVTLLLFFPFPYPMTLPPPPSPLYWSKEKEEIPSFCHTSRRLKKKERKTAGIKSNSGYGRGERPRKESNSSFFYQPTFSFFCVYLFFGSEPPTLIGFSFLRPLFLRCKTFFYSRRS